MFSGCRDEQTSADAKIDGHATGAASWSLLKCLKSNPNPTLTELLRDLRGHLHGQFQQVPQMSTSHLIPVNDTRFGI